MVKTISLALAYLMACMLPYFQMCTSEKKQHCSASQREGARGGGVGVGVCVSYQCI